MTDIFIFSGGAYKRDLVGRDHPQDDGDYRTPLNCAETQHVVHDPELPGRDAPGAFGSTFFMAKHIGRHKSQGGLGGLEVGDYVYVHLLPTMGIWHSIAVATDYGLTDFGAELEVVDACEVYTAIAGGGTGADVTPMVAPVAHDFESGLGNSIKSAITYANFDCSTGEDANWSKYRNPDSVTHEAFSAPVITKGHAAYVRLRITAVPDTWEGECSSCHENNPLPRIQLSLTGHTTCIRMNELLPYCNCESVICAGCDNGCDDC